MGKLYMEYFKTFTEYTAWLHARSGPSVRCGTLTHDNHDSAAHGAVRGLDWSGDVTWTDGGTAIIEGEKPDSTHQGLKDNISKY